MTNTVTNNTLTTLTLPKKCGDKITLGCLHGGALGLAIAQSAQTLANPLLVIVEDMLSANRLQDEIHFFDPSLPLLIFPDWETLPFDSFSPHQDIISKRLETLSGLGISNNQTILIVPVSTLMHRLLDHQFLKQYSFVMKVGDVFDPQKLAKQLQANGYHHVSQVMEHGEFSIRGSIVDIYPMGSQCPYRIDLFDNDVDSIRVFDPESQISVKKINEIKLLPAKEYPLDELGITRFRQQWRSTFEGNPSLSPLYQSISDGISSPGIEYYLPLFFEKTSTLLFFRSKP